MQAQLLISLVGGAALVAGADLAGFQIAMDPALLVVYGSTPAMGGVVVDKAGNEQIQTMKEASSKTKANLK